MKILDYADIQDEFNAWKAKNPGKQLGLADYAKQKDIAEGGQPVRQQAYDPGVLKDLNAHVDRFFRPVSALAGKAGAAIDEGLMGLGLDSKGAGEANLKELPRALVELMPFSGPAGKVNLARRALQGLGMASAGVNAYSDTDSAVAGAIGAAGLPVGVKAAELGEQLAAKYLARGTVPEMIERVGAEGLKRTNVKDALGVFTGGNVAAGLVGEAQRMGTIGAVMGEDTTLEALNPFTVENAVSQAVGVLPEVAMRTGPELVSGRGSERVQQLRGEKVDQYMLKELDLTGKAWDEIVQLSQGDTAKAKLIRREVVSKLRNDRAEMIRQGLNPDDPNAGREMSLPKSMMGVMGVEFEGPDKPRQEAALNTLIDQTGLPSFYQEGVAKGGRSIRQTVGKARIDKFLEGKKFYTLRGENEGLTVRQGIPAGQELRAFDGLDKGVALVFSDESVKLGTDGRTLQPMPTRPDAVMIDVETAGGRLTEIEKGKKVFETFLTAEQAGYTPEERKAYLQKILEESIAVQQHYVKMKAEYEAAQAAAGQQAKVTTTKEFVYDRSIDNVREQLTTEIRPFSETKEGKELLAKVQSAYARMASVPHLTEYRNYGLKDVGPGFGTQDSIVLKLMRLGVPENLPVYIYEKGSNGQISFLEKVRYDQLAVEKALNLAGTPTEKIADVVSLGAFVRDVNALVRELWEQDQVIERTNKSDLARAKRLRMMVLGPETRFLPESGEALKRDELTAVNPAALKMYQDQGYIPRIDQKLLAKIFGKQWENSITYTDQEAYYGMIQTVKNYLYQAVDDAKARKAQNTKTDYFSAQRRKTDTELDEEYFGLLAQLPPDLQREVIKFRSALEGNISVAEQKNVVDDDGVPDKGKRSKVRDRALYGDEQPGLESEQTVPDVDKVLAEEAESDEPPVKIYGKNVNEEALSPEQLAELATFRSLRNVAGKEQSYVPGHVDIVIEAIKRWDRQTGLTTITRKKRISVLVKDKKTGEEKVVNRFVPVEETLPIEKALLVEPPARPIFAGRINRNTVSWEAFQEMQGKVGRAGEEARTETEFEDDIETLMRSRDEKVDPEAPTDGRDILNKEDIRDPGARIEEGSVEAPGQKSDSKNESDSSEGFRRTLVRQYLDQFKDLEAFEKLWRGNLKKAILGLDSIFSGERNNDPDFKQLVPLAVDAKLAPRQGKHGKGEKLTPEGDQILLTFGEAWQAYLQKKDPNRTPVKVTSTAAASWLKDAWSIGKNKDAAWNRLLERVREHVEAQLPKESQERTKTAYTDLQQKSTTLPEHGVLQGRGRTFIPNARKITAEEFAKTHLTRYFREQGYTPEAVELLTTASLKAARFFDHQDLSFRQHFLTDPLSQEPYASSTGAGVAHASPRLPDGKFAENPVVGLGLTFKNEFHKHFNDSVYLVQTLAHEVMHTIGTLPTTRQAQGRPLSAQEQLQVTAWQNTKTFLSGLTVEDRRSMLQNLADVVIPNRDPDGFGHETAKLKNDKEHILSYGAAEPEETMSTYAQLIVHGASFQSAKKLKAGDLAEALKWAPDAMQDFAKMVFRDVTNALDGLETLITNPQYRQEAGLQPLTGDMVKVLEGTKQMNQLMKQLIRPDMEVLQAKKTLAETLSYLDRGSLTALANGGDAPPPVKAVREAHDFLFGKEVVGGKKMNFWNRWFMPFQLAAARTNNPLATDIAQVLLDVNASRIYNGHLMYRPIMKRDKDDVYRTDANSALKRLANEKPKDGVSRAYTAFNKISGYMQYLLERGTLDGIALQRDKEGRVSDAFAQLIASSPEMRDFAQKEFAKLSPTERGMIIGGFNEALEIYQNAGNVMVVSQSNHVTVRIAHLFHMTGTKSSKEALFRADKLMQGLMNMPGPLRDQLIRQAFDGMDSVVSNKLFEVGVDLAKQVQDLQAMLDSRPFFMSEQRPGKFLVVSKSDKGERQTHGADSHAHAQEIIKTLEKRGNGEFRIVDKDAEYKEYAGMLPERFADTFIKMEQVGFEKAMQKVKALFPNLTPDALKVLEKTFNPGYTVHSEMTKLGMEKFKKERKLLGGREDLDYIRTLEAYIGGMMSSAANRRARDIVGLFLKDESFAGMPDFVNMAETQLEHTLRPANETVAKLKNVTSAYFLGLNLSSMLVEGTQNLITVVPYLIRDGDSISKAYGRLGSAIKELANMPKGAEFEAAQRRGILANAKPEEERMHWYRKFIDEHPDGTNAYDDMNIHDDLSSVLTARNRHGNLEDVSKKKLALNALYHGSRFMMKFYGKVSNWNNKIAFLAAFQKAQEAGLHGEAAYSQAQQMVFGSTFGGGRANNPGWVGQLAKATPAVGLFHTLQQYSVGMASLMGSFAKDAVMGNKELSHIERKQLIKSAGVLWGTQFALAGSLGLPGVAAGLKIIDTIFGTNSEADIREYLAEQFGKDDEEMGFMVSDAAMNGIGTQLLEKAGIGVDISSRTGVSSLVGTSGYHGFNISDFFGPSPQIVKNMLKSVGSAAQGNFATAGKELAPQAFKNLVEMFDTRRKYGQFQMMDQYNNMIGDMTNMEALTYAIGFRSGENRRYRTAKRLQVRENQITDELRDRGLDRAAQGLLKEDPSLLVNYVTQGLRNGTISDPRDTVNSILDRAIDMSTPKDLLATRGADRGLLRAVGGQALNRQSEVQRLDIKEAALQKLGYPFGMRPAGPKERLRALVIDELTSQGLTRQEAIETFNQRFGRPAVYQTPTGEMWDVEEDQ